MGRPDPGPLKYVVDALAQTESGRAFLEERAARKLAEAELEREGDAEAADRRARAAEWAGQPLYQRGRGEATDAHPSDVVQGQHNDCFLVSAMAALVQQHPDPDRFLREVIKDNGNGTYTVTFHEYRAPVPYNPLTGRPEPAGYVKVPVTVDMGLYKGASSDDGAEKWPSVIEAAYAKAYGGEGDKPYDRDRDRLGEPMERLTGVPTVSHDPKSVSIDQMGGYLTDHQAVQVLSRNGLTGLGVPHPSYAPGGLTPPPFPPAPDPARPFEPPAPVKNSSVVQWHEYYVHKVDAATGTVVLHNVHDGKRSDITMPYATFQTAFETVRVNPVYAR